MLPSDVEGGRIHLGGFPLSSLTPVRFILYERTCCGRVLVSRSCTTRLAPLPAALLAVDLHCLPTMVSPGFLPTHLPFSSFVLRSLGSGASGVPPGLIVYRGPSSLCHVSSRRSRKSRARFGCHVTIGLGLGALHRLLQFALSRTPLGSRVLVSSRALASQMECSQLSTSPALR